MSLDKAESSNPNLTAAHAGVSTGKTRHLQPQASNALDAEGGLFCLFQTFFQDFSYSSTLKSGEKPALLRKTRPRCRYNINWDTCRGRAAIDAKCLPAASKSSRVADKALA